MILKQVLNPRFLILFLFLGFSVALYSQNNKNKIIKVGVFDSPPRIFKNDKGEPDGFFIDLIKEIAKKENLRIEYEFDTWDNQYNKLKKGEIDILPNMVYSHDRDSIFSMSNAPIITSWLEIYSNNESNVKSGLDLSKKKIGVRKGSIQENRLREFLVNESIHGCEIIVFDNYTDVLQDLKTGKIDVFVADHFFPRTKFYDKSFRPTGIIICPTSLDFAFPKGKNEELVVLFEKNIALLKNDPNSEYYKSFFRWLEMGNETSIPNYLKWVLFFVNLILIIALIFVLVLRKSVKIKTNQLLKSKEQAEESQKRLKLIADNLVNGMIYQIVTIDENVRKFNYVSDAVINFYGCTAAEVLKDPSLIYRRIHPDDLHIMRAAELDAITNMSNYSTEVRIINPDGSIRWAYTIAKPRIIDGLVCWDGIEFDISERKKLEIDLKNAKEKAEESDRLKSAFLANMSHEIRTPMNGILGFAELLKEPDLNGDQQQEYVDIIEKSGMRMLNIINDVINISKIESGQMELNLEQSNINEQVEYIYTFFKLEAQKKKIELLYKNTLAFDDAFLSTDREKLFAILTNLVKNAINHTENGSVEFGYLKKDQFLEFYVKDTGIGVPKNRQSAIFERFIQADISNKMAHQGAGLGLSISKAYVEMLGGKLWLESEEGKGCVFYFTLPFQNLKIAEKIIASDLAPPVELISDLKLKILIAEDDKISQILISKVVKDYSENIILVGNGLEAVKACRKNLDLDLILIDIQMPEMNGYEAIWEIRKFNKEVMIIAQSADVLPGDKEKAINAGANDYITKPIKVDILKQLIVRHFMV